MFFFFTFTITIPSHYTWERVVNISSAEMNNILPLFDPITTSLPQYLYII